MRSPRHAVIGMGITMLVQSGTSQNRCTAGVKNDNKASVAAVIQGQARHAAATQPRTRIVPVTRSVLFQSRSRRKIPGNRSSWLYGAMVGMTNRLAANTSDVVQIRKSSVAALFRARQHSTATVAPMTSDSG